MAVKKKMSLCLGAVDELRSRDDIEFDTRPDNFLCCDFFRLFVVNISASSNSKLLLVVDVVIVSVSSMRGRKGPKKVEMGLICAREGSEVYQ